MQLRQQLLTRRVLRHERQVSVWNLILYYCLACALFAS